jgi:gamma-glutamylcyclotransferase (GGCT)/AIG2-like uncharacterized protein YtfP
VEKLKSNELVQEIKKHFAVLAEDGSALQEIKEIASGIMVAVDVLDEAFMYYFDNTRIEFRKDRHAQMWGANDQSGQPEGCIDQISGFVCGVMKPGSWNNVIFQAKQRLVGKGDDEIAWHKSPLEISF